MSDVARSTPVGPTSGPSGLMGGAWKGWNADSGPLLAAGLAFYGALAISPLIIIAAAASLQFGGNAVSARQVFDPIASVVGPSAAGTVASTVKHSAAATGGSTSLQVVALTFAVLGATGLFLQFRAVLDIVFQMDRPTGFVGWAGDVARSFAAVACLAALLAVNGLASRVATSVVAKASRPMAVTGVRFITALILIGLVPVAYRYLARHHMAWGAAIAASVVALGDAAIVTFLAWLYFNTGAAAKVYGPAASMFVGLVWLLMVGSGLVFGAETACVWQHSRAGGQNG